MATATAEALMSDFDVVPGDVGAGDMVAGGVQQAFETFRKETKDQQQIDARRRLEEKLEQRRLERELKEFDFDLE
jgi:hypothetical protein